MQQTQFYQDLFSILNKSKQNTQKIVNDIISGNNQILKNKQLKYNNKKVIIENISQQLLAIQDNNNATIENISSYILSVQNNNKSVIESISSQILSMRNDNINIQELASNLNIISANLIELSSIVMNQETQQQEEHNEEQVTHQNDTVTQSSSQPVFQVNLASVSNQNNTSITTNQQKNQSYNKIVSYLSSLIDQQKNQLQILSSNIQLINKNLTQYNKEIFNCLSAQNELIVERSEIPIGSVFYLYSQNVPKTFKICDGRTFDSQELREKLNNFSSTPDLNGKQINQNGQNRAITKQINGKSVNVGIPIIKIK